MADNPPDGWGDLSEDEQAALQDLAQARVDGSMSRRQALKAGGLGIAGLLGVSGGASADTTSTSTDPFGDGDGTVGTSSNPVDVYADGVDATAVQAVSALIGDPDDSNRPRLTNARTTAPQELTLQPETGDGVGSALLLPSGSDDRSHWMAGNSSDPSNFGAVKWEVDGTTANVMSFSKGNEARPTELIHSGFSSIQFFEGPGLNFNFDGTNKKIKMLLAGVEYTDYDIEIGRPSVRTIVHDDNGDPRYLDGNGDWVLL